MKNLYSLILFLIVAGNVIGQVNCDRVLSTNTYHFLNTESRSRLAWLNLVDSKNYEDRKQEFGVNLPGYFSGDFTSFSKKRQEDFRLHSYDSNQEESRRELEVVLPTEAYVAWIDCIHATAYDLFVSVEKADEFVATLRIEWNPPRGLSGPLEEVEIALVGANNTNLLEVNSIPRGVSRFIVTRRLRNGVIRGVINGKINGDSYSSMIYVPAMDLHTNDIQISETPVEICSCVGHGGLESVAFWGPKGEPCNGLPEWGTYQTSCREVSKVGRCTGYGGVNGLTMWGPVGELCAGIGVWGVYGGNPVDVSLQPSGKAVEFCSCRGHGDILNNMNLWGPKNEFCGGIAPWGNYDSSCK